MCTGGENSLILIKLYIYVQVFYMVRLPSKKKKKKKNTDLSTHFFSGMLPETFFFFWPYCSISKTCPCNVYMYSVTPHTPLLCGESGVCRGILVLLQNVDFGNLLEPPPRVPIINVLSKDIKNINVFPVTFSFFTAEKNNNYVYMTSFHVLP